MVTKYWVPLIRRSLSTIWRWCAGAGKAPSGPSVAPVRLHRQLHLVSWSPLAAVRDVAGVRCDVRGASASVGGPASGAASAGAGQHDLHAGPRRRQVQRQGRQRGVRRRRGGRRQVRRRRRRGATCWLSAASGTASMVPALGAASAGGAGVRSGAGCVLVVATVVATVVDDWVMGRPSKCMLQAACAHALASRLVAVLWPEPAAC